MLICGTVVHLKKSNVLVILKKSKYLKIDTNNLYIIEIVIHCSIWKSLRLSIVTKQVMVKQTFLCQKVLI